MFYARISNFDNIACIGCLNRSVIRRVFCLFPLFTLPLKSSADINLIHGLNIWCFFNDDIFFFSFLASSSSLRCWQSLWCWWFISDEVKLFFFVSFFSDNVAFVVVVFDCFSYPSTTYLKWENTQFAPWYTVFNEKRRKNHLKLAPMSSMGERKKFDMLFPLPFYIEIKGEKQLIKIDFTC